MQHNPEDHLKLVHKIANRFNGSYRMEYEDIFQEGCLGLMRACSEYKDCDVPFGAFAGMHIKFAILNAFRGNNLLHVEARTIEIAAKINKLDLADYPVGEIAKKIKVRPDLVERALCHLQLDVLSLDFEYKGHRGGVVTLESSGIVAHEVNFEDSVYIEQMLDVFEVEERDKPILRMVLNGYQTKEAAMLVGESYKAVQQRKSLRKYQVADKKHLAYA